MEFALSKIRTQRTRAREKKASRGGWRDSAAAHRLGLSLPVAAGIWLVTVVIIAWEHPLTEEISEVLKSPLVADAWTLLAGMIIAALILSVARPGVIRNGSSLLLLAVICLVALIPARIVQYLAYTVHLFDPTVAAFCMPFALAPLCAALLFDGAVGAAIGFWNCLVMATMLGGGIPLFVAGLASATVAAKRVGRARTRTRVLRAGVAAGLVGAVCAVGISASGRGALDAALVLAQSAACLLSGFFSALVALIVLPALESLFQMATNITLLELSDHGHPLLQRLAIEAPGTYHHSLVVASLAQAAADEIGANSLLARVCAYFHDVGKLTKPEFFSENITSQRNPHDSLRPSVSALVIMSHVKEGLTLAIHYRLPTVVRTAIQEHHGTSLVSWFHHKAKSMEDETSRGVVEADFRYPGPKPSSRESAIVCLADPVEAASRAMEKVTPRGVENLVDDVVASRTMDGQLDNCPLTFADVTRIKQSFVFTLTNMLHARISYPRHETNDQEPANALPDRRSEDQAAGEASDEPSR
jgi:cyclic-di-AMP phosphodiesterase PgpH